MKKHFLALILLIVLSLTLPINASKRVTTATPSLSFDDATAHCGITIWGNSNDALTATLTLWRGDFMMESWNSTGTGSLHMNNSVVVTKGYTYRLEALVTINGETSTHYITKACN